MEKLALGLTLVCLIYTILLLGYTLWQESWILREEGRERWLRKWEKLKFVLKNMSDQSRRDHTKKAA